MAEMFEELSDKELNQKLTEARLRAERLARHYDSGMEYAHAARVLRLLQKEEAKRKGLTK
jgi:hypothetical protein